jgi:hypothetical protein
MVIRLKIVLEQAEYGALLKVATAELRNPADQMRHILRQDLSRRGLLPDDPVSIISKSSRAVDKLFRHSVLANDVQTAEQEEP